MTLYIVFGKKKEVVCDPCVDELGYTFHQRRTLTASDVQESIDLNKADQLVMGLPPLCAYCGHEEKMEDLPDGT
jgi:hypothetical protein